ncbi:sulfurtransferase TusA family protein [Bacillaceae bacterium S4-13-56]
MEIKTDVVIDAKGLACPMPIVKTKKTMSTVDPGKVVLVEATDKGSLADIKAWAKSSGHEYIGSVEEEGVLKHYLRKGSNEEKEEKKHPHVVNNDQLSSKLDENADFILVDVREPAEFVFSHIPGAVSIPFGQLEERIDKLEKEKEIYVVCRTGNRSDMACQVLTEKGFEKVINVVPGMSEWSGPIEKMGK